MEDNTVEFGGDAKELPKEVIRKVHPLSVEAYETYTKDNAKEHNTALYKIVTDAKKPSPVLRRGQPFNIALSFDRAPNLKHDGIRLFFYFGARPAINRGTKAILVLAERDELRQDTTQWDARISQITGKTAVIQVKSPVSAPVGLWKLDVLTLVKGTSKQKKFTVKDKFYMLFNPWNSGDQVYMAEDNLRQEYVESDEGKVWKGSYRHPIGLPWVFGQYDDCILPTTMILLKKAKLEDSVRGDAVQVTRAISAIINSNDDNGLIEGQWGDDYRDGVPPYAWTGSVAIFKPYLKSGGRMPVKYGQCWVFSAATVTVCRALGIPCRSVTNYLSGHDTDGSLTLDKCFTSEGNRTSCHPDDNDDDDDKIAGDSSWNFHVWADAWMARPDLPAGYGGWQAVDATPQEPSEDDMYRCGPASVVAIRQGDVDYDYDTQFVFSEVNADICYLYEDETSPGRFRRRRLDQNIVGKLIVTKKVGMYVGDRGTEDMEDITAVYKDSEGSIGVRLALYNAVSTVSDAQLRYEWPENITEDVSFVLKKFETISIGDPLVARVQVQNGSDEARTIYGVIYASSVTKTGVAVHRLDKAEGSFKLAPGGEKVLEMKVPPKDYINRLMDDNLVKIYAIAHVEETKQTWREGNVFSFEMPNLNINLL